MIGPSDLAGPIVRSRLEPDFYKFTMGQLIWRKSRDVETTFTFRNRTAKARLGEVIDLVSRELKPHHLCSYLYELATRFSSFYENCPVLQSDEPTRSSRLLLCDATARALAKGLDLLGIEHPEQM